MTVLVLGATGSTGRRVTEQLRERQVAVRPASRDGETHFAWDDPQTWATALDGADAVYVMAPDGVPVDPAFLDQAATAGVERLVLLSTVHPDVVDPRLLAAEEAVQVAGPSWTVVRAQWFNQNFDEGFFRPAILAGHLAVPVGDQRQAFVDATDIAAVAVQALTTDGHHARTYQVTGPDALTFAEAVAIIAETTGRPLTFDGTPEGYLATPGADPDQLAHFTRQQTLGDSTPTGTVARVTGRPPVPFRTYATQAARTGTWTP